MHCDSAAFSGGLEVQAYCDHASSAVSIQPQDSEDHPRRCLVSGILLVCQKAASQRMLLDKRHILWMVSSSSVLAYLG